MKLKCICVGVTNINADTIRRLSDSRTLFLCNFVIETVPLMQRDAKRFVGIS